MPRKYQKGKSNRSVKNTSIWTLMKRGQFAFDGDLRTLKSFYKLEDSFETNPNISNKINVSEKVEDKKKAYEENELIAYNKKQEEERQYQLQKIREREQKEKEEAEKRLQHLQKGFGKPVSTYNERKYIYWCDPGTPINRGKLGSSQPWRYKKEKGFYD